jgi:hypothetical protein
MEFTLKSGSIALFFRLGRRADFTVESYEIRSAGEGAVKPGKKYGAEASIIGSRFNLRIRDDDFQPYENPAIRWTQSRKGQFGIVVTDGTQMEVTKLQFRLLR